MKIAVLGSHPITKMLAPFGDPEWAIFACSPHNFHTPDWPKMFIGGIPPKGFPDGRLPRVDAWFEVHTPAVHETRSPEYLDYVRELSGRIPVYMRDRSGHPKALAYPVKETERRFGPFFFTSSIAYLMAFAIMQKPEMIGIWGVMQATATEFAYQRPGIQYFIQQAWNEGIKVVAPEQSRLFDVTQVNW